MNPRAALLFASGAAITFAASLSCAPSITNERTSSEEALSSAALAKEEAAPAPRRVGLFAGNGAGQEYVTAVREVVGNETRFSLTTFTNGTVDFGRLDVVVFPGGASTTEWNALGATGQQKLRAFVEQGGGYVGICAGFYMALETRAGFIDADNYEPWARGEGSVAVTIAEDAGVFDPAMSGTRRFRYVNGPIIPVPSILPEVDTTAPGYRVLATFAGNIGSASIETMIGKPAVVATTHGRGRVVTFSPHPELSGLGSLLKDALVWTARRDVGPAP